MAEEKEKKKKKEDAKIVLERTYNIPLRKEWLKAPKYKRTKKAITAIKEFLIKHMKGNEVKVGKHLNTEMWKHGIKNPPHHIKVEAKKDEEGVISVEIIGAPTEEKKEEKKKPAKKEDKKPEEKESKKEEKLDQLARVKEEDKKKEKPTEEKKEATKPAPKDDKKTTEEVKDMLKGDEK